MSSPIPELSKLSAYSLPSLKVYGNVVKLTASGTGVTAENGNTPTCSTSPTRKPC